MTRPADVVDTADHHAEIGWFPGPDHVFGDGRGTTVGLRVVPASRVAWTAEVTIGDRRSPRLIEGLIEVPGGPVLCVLARGTAHLVDVRAPQDHRTVHMPVTDALSAPGLRMLVLASPWTVEAYTVDGRLWSTGRVATDGLRLVGSDATTVHVLSDPDDDEPRDLVIDATSGDVIGRNPYDGGT